MEKAPQQRGFTLVEVTIILLVLVVLSTIMVPQLGSFNRLARYVRVKEDLGALCSALKVMLDDVGESAFYHDAGYAGPPDRSQAIGLLVGKGDIPGKDDSLSHRWTLPAYDQFAVKTDGGGLEIEFVVDKLANHLIENTPLDDADNHWRTAVDMNRGFNSSFAWRGPYVNDDIVPDPWGNRYAANVFAMYNPRDAGAHDRFASAVVCHSAGPDSTVDTMFNQPYGWTTGDDDLTTILNAGGPM